MQEIEHKRADPRAVLHRRVDAVRKQRPRLRAASGASAIVRTMLGDDERPRLGQIEHLPGAVADARVLIQARAAPGAGRRVMIDHDVGIGDLPQRLAFVALLPARFLAGPVPQACYPRRLLQPITRRRLAAVRTVQPEPALELRQPRLQRRILGLQGRDQRDKVVHRWRTRRQFASHPMLESEPASAVERIFSPNPAVAQPGQLQCIYTDVDRTGVALDGNNLYVVTFAEGELPPANAFWPMTLYNEGHLFHPNDLNPFSLGTNNKTWKFNDDGSLTLYAGAKSPGKDKESNSLPAPRRATSRYIFGPTGRRKVSLMAPGSRRS